VNEAHGELRKPILERLGFSGTTGYSLGETKPRPPLYEHPEYDFAVTEELTNLHLD
jgi:hypothetical protein